MKKLSKKHIILMVSICFFMSLGIWAVWGNTALEINEYTIVSDEIPQDFDDFRIAQISDLHNDEFGEDNEKLVRLLSRSSPDMIVITGDLIDSRHTNIGIALEFVQQAMKLAPVYYVSGNHESRVLEYEALKTGLIEAGVVILENQKVRITRNGAYITLIGIDDSSFRNKDLFEDGASASASALSELQNESDGYTVLLAHRPELFHTYANAEIDLVFSGHAHGGQFCLPFVGGLFAPHQGFFPKFDAGLFSEGSTSMIVSRGLGKSIIPLRFNNRPEIVVAELKSVE